MKKFLRFFRRRLPYRGSVQAELNEAHRCCQNIAMMAALLEACGHYPSLKSGVAAKTGQIISEDVAVVHAVLRRLEDELARR
jgi:hypothetical protein